MINRQIDSSLQEIADQWYILVRSSSLTDLQEKAFFEWLNANEEHQRAYLDVESLWQRGGALEGAIERVEKQATAETSNGLGLWQYSTGIAASIAVVAVVLLLRLGGQEQEFKQYQTHVGEQKKVVLDDGSVATLNTRSLLVFNPDNTEHREFSLTNGEVFFDVKPDKTKPFTVKTNEGVVVVLGTKFSIAKKRNRTVVTVIEGKVGLLPGIKKWQGQKPETELVKNQKIELSASKHLMPEKVNAVKALSWRSGQRYYELQTLTEVIEDLNRYYDKSFVIGDDSLKSKRIVAMIPVENSFDKTLMVLEKTLGLRSKVSSNGKDVILMPAKALP